MKRVMAIGLLALAPAAAGQVDGFILTATNPVLTPAGFDTEIILSATFPTADYAFAGARLSVTASEMGWSDPSTIAPGGAGPGTSAGVIGGTDITGIIVGQLNFPTAMIFADPSNPIDVWKATFKTTNFSIREVHFATVTTQFAVYPSRDSSVSETRTPVEAQATIAIIPAPGAATLLGLGALAVWRRRRSAAM